MFRYLVEITNIIKFMKQDISLLYFYLFLKKKLETIKKLKKPEGPLRYWFDNKGRIFWLPEPTNLMKKEVRLQKSLLL